MLLCKLVSFGIRLVIAVVIGHFHGNVVDFVLLNIASDWVINISLRWIWTVYIDCLLNLLIEYNDATASSLVLWHPHLRRCCLM